MDRVLVLNADYTPINVTSQQRGFNLVYKGKAEVLKSSDNPIYASYENFVRPLIIRLLKYVKYKIRNIKVNRTRIFRRDNEECVYCGSTKQLTLDHVIPRSRGGSNSWDNLVTCCHNCNVRNPLALAPGGYTVDGDVRQFGKKGDTIKRYKFVGLFPTDLTPIDVDWGSNDTIEEFSVSLSYQWWESVEDGVV